MFHSNLVALANAEAVVAICDGPQVDDGTAWEIAYVRNIQVYGLRTNSRIGQKADERGQPHDPRVAERALAAYRAARPHDSLCGAAVSRRLCLDPMRYRASDSVWLVRCILPTTGRHVQRNNE